MGSDISFGGLTNFGVCFGYEYDAWAFGSAKTESGIGFRRDVTTFYTYPDTTPDTCSQIFAATIIISFDHPSC